MASAAAHVGRFDLDPSTARWRWSEEMYRIHGIEPGGVVPTRALFLDHAHCDDRTTVASTLDAGEPASCDYRLVDLAGREHQVTLSTSNDDSGRLTGHLIDETVPRDGTTEPRPFDLQMGTRHGAPALGVNGRADCSHHDEVAVALELLTTLGLASGRVVVDLRHAQRVEPAIARLIGSAMRRCADQGVTMTVVGGGEAGLDEVPHARHPDLPAR